jgi:hypothetical protein
MLDFFKNIFGKDSEEISQYIADKVETPNISVVEKQLENFKKQTIIPQNEHNMAEFFLVTLDTTGNNIVKGIPKTIQNFYFIKTVASGNNTAAENAKSAVMNTFPQNVAYNLESAIRVTPLNQIFDTMKIEKALWSYIPMRGQRLPGQQSTVPSPESLLGKDEFGDMSARAVNPVTPLEGIAATFTPAELAAASTEVGMSRNAGSSPTVDPNAPTTAQLMAQMAAMQQQMLLLMQSNANAQQPNNGV